MNLFKISFCSCLFLPAFAGYSQVHKDLVKQLPIVEVSSSRLSNFSSGNKIQTFDSTLLNRYSTGNLADLLANESQVFIKSYGLGSLATTSFRGGSANHTAILWNGFNLNSPMNGQLDLSLIPNSFINNINILYGGTSALWGSGAVGGTILLNNEVKFDKGLSVTAGSTFGSFLNYGQNLQIEFSAPKWVSSIKLISSTAKNDFEYFNNQLEGSPKIRQSNADLKEYGLLAENYFRLNEKQKINVRFWYQYNDRNIPPTMLQTVNKTNQKDENYRVTSEWQRVSDKITSFARIAYFDERLVYSDYAFNYESLNRSQTIIAETEMKIRLSKNHFVNTGINNTFEEALSDGYPYKPKQNRLAAFASYRFNSTDNKFFATLSARQEIVKGSLVPFTYSAGGEYILSKWFSIKGSASKVYRIPTFNDLYWNPGGNINLLPESGYCEEAGVSMKLTSKNSKINFLFEPTIFNRNMGNWILWLPGQNYWSPQNIMQVWSRGMETKTELTIQISKVKLKISVLTNYVVSTNEKAKTEDDASVNKQLIYVPMYSGHGKVAVEYKEFLLSINQNYAGYSYTSTDNSEYLKPYKLTNIYACYKIIFNKYAVNLFMQVNNLFNEQYQIVRNRAMSLINYQGGISIQFNKPKNNN